MRLDAMLKGNDVVQQHLAAERSASLLVVSPKAREAIEQEIVPQLEAGVVDVGTIRGLADSTKIEIEAAFKNKTPTYTSLISYKSIDQSDAQYLDDLLHVLDEWAAKMITTLDHDAEAPDEVTIKVHVDSEVAVKIDKGVSDIHVEQPTVNVDVPSGDVDVPSGDDDFDFDGVRL